MVLLNVKSLKLLLYLLRAVVLEGEELGPQVWRGFMNRQRRLGWTSEKMVPRQGRLDSLFRQLDETRAVYIFGIFSYVYNYMATQVGNNALTINF